MEYLEGHHVTYPTRCRNCGEAIFFHTNGYGDVVLFDELGPPWPMHGCYEARIRDRIVRDYQSYRAYMVSVYGTPNVARTSRKARVSFPATRPRREVISQPASVALDIQRCDPRIILRKHLNVIGFVHAIHTGRSLSRFASEGSVGYAMYHKIVGSSRYSQLTVVDADLMSYTMIVPSADLGLPLGAIVNVRLTRHEMLGNPIYVCDSLSVLRLEAD